MTYSPDEKWKDYDLDDKCKYCGTRDYLSKDKVCLTCYHIALEKHYFRLRKRLPELFKEK